MSQLSGAQSQVVDCGTKMVAGNEQKLYQGSQGGCYYLTASGNKSYVNKSECNCGSSSKEENSNQINLRSAVIVDKGIYTVSYNEIYEQPNWLTYTVSNRAKNVDRGSMNFYEETGIHTSDNADYNKNPWDKGHLAPAAAFSDSYTNLKTTFSFLNCSMQLDRLNQGEWAELEAQVRKWSKQYGYIDVKIELYFAADHQVRNTGVHIPTGFWKYLTFPNDTKKCFYFPNEDSIYNWDRYEQKCPDDG